MIATLNLIQHDLQPYYYMLVKDTNNAAIDLTGATIYCTMKNIASDSLKINRQTTGIAIANQTTNKGEFEYRWQSGDTNTIGVYLIEFEINPASGGKFTLPTDLQGIAKISIRADADNT